MRNILGMIDSSDILLIESKRDDKGNIHQRITLGGEELDNASRTLLREETVKFNNSFLWKLLLRHVKWQSIQQAFAKDDLKGGQDMMLTLSTMQSLIDDIQKKLWLALRGANPRGRLFIEPNTALGSWHPKSERSLRTRLSAITI